jgi:murE/murF fusion protein
MITLGELIQSIACPTTVRVPEALLCRPVTAVTADSREVIPGSLFVAIRGEKSDGREYIAEATRKGCLAVVLETDDGVGALAVPTILVEDCHAVISDLAAAWYGYPAEQMVLIGITGTNGKTTCSYLIEGMLVAAGYRPGVLGTINYRYQGPDGPHIIQDAPLTTPDPVRLQQLFRTMADQQVTHVVMEVSSHALLQKRLGRTGFDVALFTNLSRDHLDYHLDMQRYFDAKKLLFTRHLKQNGKAVVVLNAGAEGVDWSEALVQAIPDVALLRCGLQEQYEVCATALSQTLEGFRCVLRLNGDEAVFSSPLPGGYNVLNVLAAAGVGVGLGLPVETIRRGLAGVGRVPGRLERVFLPGKMLSSGPAVFVDYAHTPDALENVLRSLRGLASGRLICVFGCGGDRDRGKRPLMGSIAGQYANVVIVTSDNPRTEAPEAIIDAIVQGLSEQGKQRLAVDEILLSDQQIDGYAVIADRRRAIASACSLALPGDSVLVAGKGHEEYQLIGTQKHFFDDRLEVLNGLLRWNEHHLVAATGGWVVAGRQRQLLAQVSTDSRHLQQGDVFIALNGENFDGHAYIDAAVANGAGAVIAERMPRALSPEVLYLQVSDTLRALGELAAYRRRLLAPEVKVAAITGSSGKTTVKEMTAAIFSQALHATRTGIDPLLKTKGNFNNLVGLPLSLLPLEAGHRLAILEMGMNAPGEIARLTAIADPDIGCINNVHPAHLLGLGSIEGVARAKGELFAGMRPEAVRVVNCDDLLVVALAKQSGGRQVGFAVTATGRRQRPQIQVTRQVNLGESGMRFTLHIGPWSARITVPVHGSHNVANCAAAAAIAHAAGIEPAAIVQGLQAYTPVDKRLVLSTLPGGLRLVNDAYNANPASMAAGLRAVAAFGKNCRHVAALGDMLELGEASETLHRQIGTLVAALGYDRLAITGSQASLVARAALDGGMQHADVQIFPEPRAIADWLCAMLADGTLSGGDWLLVKGSRGMRMERLIEALEQRLKTHH